MRITICIFLLGLSTGMLNAQQSEVDNYLQNKASSKRAFKTELPAADKMDTWEVKSVGNVSFATSNTADGTVNSYQHALRITMTLVMTDTRAGNVQLVFYSEGEPMPFAVIRNGTDVAIYYPVAVYADIKEKLEQSLAARKRVTVKVTEKTTGYREGVLNF